MNEPKNRKIFNNFTELFGDAIVCYEQTISESATPRLAVTNTKLSILLSAFALEAAANSLIFSMDLRPTLGKRVERFSVMEKFQVFLESLYSDRRLDATTDEIRKVQEIITFRNNQVHPKVGHQELVVRQDGTLFANYVPTSSLLGLPEFFAFLRPDQALASLQAVDRFLEQFLLETASLSVGETTQLLCHRMVLDGYSSNLGFTSEIFKDSHERFVNFGIHFKYINPRNFNANYSVK